MPVSSLCSLSFHETLSSSAVRAAIRFQLVERVKFNWLKMSTRSRQCFSYESSLMVFFSALTGIAVDKNGLMYFVDATMIRKVDQNGIISTLLGANDLTTVRPLSCDTSMDVSQVWGSGEEMRWWCDRWWSNSPLSAELCRLCGNEPARRSGRDWFRDGLKSPWINDFIKREWGVQTLTEWRRDLSEPWRPFKTSPSS